MMLTVVLKRFFQLLMMDVEVALFIFFSANFFGFLRWE